MKLPGGWRHWIPVIFALAVALPSMSQRKSPDTINSIRAKTTKTSAKSAKLSSRRKAAKTAARRSASKPKPPKPSTANRKPAPAPPPQTVITVRSQGFLWKTQTGANVLEADEQGIHLAQRIPKDTTSYASAATALNLRSAALWKVGFAVQFGRLGTTGTRIGLECGNGLIAQVSADGVQNGFTAFIAGAEARFARKYDADWHRFELFGIDNRASIWMDGEQIGEGPIPGRPERIAIAAVSQAAGRQTEMSVRGLVVEPSNASQGMVNLFNGLDLAGWTLGRPLWRVDGGVLHNVGTGQPDCLLFGTRIPAETFVFSMRIRALDGLRTRIFVVREESLLASLAGIYLGAYDEKLISLYGNDLENIKSVTSPAYKFGEWHDLRLEADSNDNVVLLQNGAVTFTAHRTSRNPIWIAVCAGDGYSAGHVEISSVRLFSEVSKTGRVSAAINVPSSPPRTH